MLLFNLIKMMYLKDYLFDEYNIQQLQNVDML